MSVTIDSLDIQIRSSAGSAAANIDRLADSLGKLRENAKLTVVANNLSKLSDALGKLQSSSSGLSSLKGLAGAMKSLSQVEKSSGLNSTINSLKKLPEIVNQLDSATMTAFSAKIRELASALAPLSTQLDSVSRSFSKLPARISQIVTGTNKMAKATRDAANAQEDHGEAINATSLNLATALSNIQNYIQGITALAQKISATMADAIEWDGIQFRFGRAFGEDAEEVLAYAEKLSDVLQINQQQFMQYSSMFGSLLSGFGMSQDKITDISVGLTELSYDIWAAYNDRYKTYEDAFEAVRSAITGEIEPIRNAGIALTEASMQEYLDSIGMASVSIEKLTEAQKSEVRYAVMVNSAMSQGIVGTYAKEMNTAEGAVRSLTQQMKTLKQAFGSLFIPILQVAVPWITAFVEVLTDAVYWVAALFGIDMQKISWGSATSGVGELATGAEDASNALGGAADAAKKLKSYTMGFDELNVINPSSDSSGGAGAGGAGDGWGSGLDLDKLWDDSIFENASKKVDEIKAKILEWKVPILVALGLLGTAGMISVLGTVISKIVNMTNLIRAFSGAIKGSSAAMSALSFISPKWANVASIFPAGGTLVSAIGTWVTGTLVPALANVLTKLPTVLSAIARFLPWTALIAAIISAIALAIVDKDFTDIGYKIGHALGNALKKVGEWLGVVGEWIVDIGKGILKGINAAWEWVKKEFDINNVFELILLMFNPRAWLEKIIPKMIEIGKEVLPGLWQGIKNGWNNFWGNIKEFIDGFIQGFKDGLGIASPSKVFAEIGGYVLEGFLNGIRNGWNNVKKWFTETVMPKFTLAYWTTKFDVMRQAIVTKLDEFKKVAIEKWAGITSWFATSIAPKFTLTFWLNKFSAFKEGFTQTIKNMLNSGIDLINRFIGWLNSKMRFSWEAFEIAGKEIVPGGSIQLFTIPQITQRFADGGFIEDGLFTMNHGEIAGRFSNGKSVVANNQQIVEGIAAGVYEAVVAAMSAASGREQNVNVYLDGKQIYASVKKTESERGRTLMGNQLGYVY